LLEKFSRASENNAFIAVYSLISKNDNNLLLQTLLPLWGTWVGTVLAFYFGKNNFEAAANSYADVIAKLTPQEKMAKLLVKDYMVTLNQLVYLSYDDEKDKKIYDILNYERFKPYNRFAVLNNDRVAMYIIHRSMFNQFISTKVEENLRGDEIKDFTLEYFLENCDETIKKALEIGFAVASINATLLEAKIRMEAKSTDCVNVFITQNGSPKEKVEGLITNNIILKESNV